MKAIEIIQEKCKQIIDEKFKGDTCMPYIMISQMYMQDVNGNTTGEIKFVLTLIHCNDEDAFDYRQSAIINLNTDMDEIIELLYNRTM